MNGDIYDLAIAFIIQLDEGDVSYERGMDLAEELGAAMLSMAEERDIYARREKVST